MLTFSEDLIQDLIHQDHTAFDTFYTETVDTFFRYILTTYYIPESDIHDILADFYVKMRKAVISYNPKQPFSAYVWTILKNTIKDYLKKSDEFAFSELTKENDETPFEDTLVDETDIVALLEMDFQQEQLEHALEKLDTSNKDIIFLKFIEEKTNAEIAQITGLSEDNVRQKLSRAIKHLKSLVTTE